MFLKDSIISSVPLLFGKTKIFFGFFEFDFIILSNVLQEIEDVSLFLKGLNQICNEDTIVHIVVPNAKSFHRLLAFEMGLVSSIYELSERNILLQQQTVFDVDGLSKTLIQNEFEVINHGSCFVKPFTHVQMHKSTEQNDRDHNMLNGLYRMTKYLPDFGAEIFINFSFELSVN